MKITKSIWIKLVIGLIVLSVIYALFIKSSFYKFNGGEVYLSAERSERYVSDFVQLAVIDGFIYECNVNGLVKKDIQGEAIWSKSFYIESPLMVTSGDYIAIGDITEREVHVFNTEGFIRTISESSQIIDLHINSNGFLTTVMEEENQNYINYYNKEGICVIKRSTSYFEDGYPLSVSTSNDVSKMVTAYLNVTNNRLQTTVSFFNFDDQYDQYEEKIVGGFTYEDTLANKVIWVNETIALAIMDNAMVIYNCKKEPKIIKTIEINSEIKQVEVTKDSIVVLYGREILASQLNQANSVIVYNLEGEEITQHVYDENISSIASSADFHYVLTSSKIIKYEGKGREWYCPTYLNINTFIEIDDERYLIGTEQGYEILVIKEK